MGELKRSKVILSFYAFDKYYYQKHSYLRNTGSFAAGEMLVSAPVSIMLSLSCIAGFFFFCISNFERGLSYSLYNNVVKNSPLQAPAFREERYRNDPHKLMIKYLHYSINNV